jgi:UDP-N-acetyl-D-glucosamine dehydrogenase
MSASPAVEAPPPPFEASATAAAAPPVARRDAGDGELASPAAAALRKRIGERTAVIGVIGLGYVGLPLARTFHAAGCTVLGYDTDEAKVEGLRAGKSYIRHVPSASIAALASSPRFTASSSFGDLAACGVVVICLPTPVGPHNEPDMSYVTSTVSALAGLLRGGALVVLESTTYPGATDTDLVDILGASGRRLGADYFLAYSPEREDPGNARFATTDIPKLVGGVDAASGALAALLYARGGFSRVERVSSARVAECAKLLENSYRAVNIALVNELKGVFRGMGVDIWEVLAAAETKPFGYARFDPGPGIGGHCIPVDPFYLAWKARETGDACAFIELAAAVNAAQPAAVVARVQAALNDGRQAVRGAHVLLVGVAYKANVDDIRCAPALEVWAGLARLGARVRYHDPYVPVVCATRRHAAIAGARSVPFTAAAVGAAGYDAVVVLTHHDCFGGYAALAGYAGVVVDTRHCVPPRGGLRIVSA